MHIYSSFVTSPDAMKTEQVNVDILEEENCYLQFLELGSQEAITFS